MNSKMKSFLALSVSALLVTACAGSFNSQRVAPTNPADAFPIMVDQQTVTLTIVADKSLSELSSMDKARLSAFVGSYAREGHGPITVTAPSGNRADYFGQELAADIRNELYSMGVGWDKMLGATYRVSGNATDQEVIVSFSRYVASATACGDFSEIWKRNRQNISSKNFGCATQNNLAAMIVDPRDLSAATPLAGSDPIKQVGSITAYQGGESTASEVETSSNISTTD
jgi:pilus assembly protein CpaD